MHTHTSTTFKTSAKGNRQGGLLQPSSGGNGGSSVNRPSPAPPSGGPNRGSGSGQSLLQPFSGNVYNSHSSNKDSSSDSSSLGSSNLDHAIVFQNTGNKPPQAIQGSSGNSPIRPVLAAGTLNSGSSVLLGQSAPSSNSGSSGPQGRPAPSSNSGSSGLLGQSAPTGDRRPPPGASGSSQSSSSGSGVSNNLLGQRPPKSNSTNINLAGYGSRRSHASMFTKDLTVSLCS
ncbi:hypothetical protein SK128_018627 [Halocaridina rubra]|uniref:Uncharacterized protein n=1 Tax=Halocaridina rubra TaxID=373956 RepID=A0AAN9A1J6_HALRR